MLSLVYPKNLLLLLFTLGISLVTSASSAYHMDDDTVHAKISLEELEEEGIEELFESPASEYYGSWSTTTIHAYKLDVTKFKDTISLNLIDSMTGFTMPVSGRVTSNFGTRRSRYHYGIDIDLNTGDSVFSCFDGVVRIAQYSTTYGYVVVVRHYNGLETLYAHLSDMKVKPGDEITSGTVVGLGGNTGRSSGSHLHFEVRFKGWALNPNDVIKFNEEQLVASSIEIKPSNFKYISEQRAIKYYTVRRGDNLSTIARRNGTTVSKICKLNRISSKTIIRPGQRLRVR